jgi:hypothetical protein
MNIMHKFLFEYLLSILSGTDLGLELLCHMVILLTYLRTTKLLINSSYIILHSHL